MTLTSMRFVSDAPTRLTSPYSTARSSFGCAVIGSSPI
jgi:hypothetical protein